MIRDHKIPKRYAHIRSDVIAMRGYHGDKYKTAISSDKPYLYMVVTRVNRMTAQLWLEDRNRKVKGKSGWCELPKVNWLVMIANFRRDEDERIKEEINAL